MNNKKIQNKFLKKIKYQVKNNKKNLDFAQKYWIGNAALHGKIAAVYANLILNGENYGPHAFLVRIRNDDGTTCPGVTVCFRMIFLYILRIFLIIFLIDC